MEGANPLDTASAPVALARPEVGTMEERRAEPAYGAMLVLFFIVVLPATFGASAGIGSAAGWVVFLTGVFLLAFLKD